MHYFHSVQQSKFYKLTQQGDRVLIYWVSVYAIGGGGFFHGRGADPVSDIDTGLKILQAMANPSTEEAYIQALKDYFAADKKVREQFIKAYNL